jgi:hypothetical protein
MTADFTLKGWNRTRPAGSHDIFPNDTLRREGPNSSVQNTGLAVTIDVGEPDNVHPLRKMEVGERLARWALWTTYQKRITYFGPI